MKKGTLMMYVAALSLQFYIHQSRVVASLFLVGVALAQRLSVYCPTVFDSSSQASTTCLVFYCTWDPLDSRSVLCCCLGSHHAKPAKTPLVLAKACSCVAHIAKPGSCRFLL